jgi:hypothetical protein
MYDYAETASAFPEFGIVPIIFSLAICIFMIITMWKLYLKAGQPGWAAIIPIFNFLVMLRVAGKPWWWIFGVLLGVIPVVGQILIIVLMIFIWYNVAKNFGKGVGFTVGMILLPIIFFPILAFGKAEYKIVEKGQAV